MKNSNDFLGNRKRDFPACNLNQPYPKIMLNHVHKITLPPNDTHEPAYIKNVYIKMFSLTNFALSNMYITF